MFLLKLIYKPFVFMFYLLFNFTYAMIKLLVKLGVFFWVLFIWLIMAILIYMATHQQWQEFVIAFCIGFASYLAANAVLGLGFIADWLNEKLLQLLMA